MKKINKKLLKIFQGPYNAIFANFEFNGVGWIIFYYNLWTNRLTNKCSPRHSPSLSRLGLLKNVVWLNILRYLLKFQRTVPSQTEGRSTSGFFFTGRPSPADHVLEFAARLFPFVIICDRLLIVCCHLWSFVVIYWLFVGVCDRLLAFVIVCCHLLIICCCLWSFVGVCDRLWSFVGVCDRLWSFVF